MLKPGDIAPAIALPQPGGEELVSISYDRGPTVAAFIETDCPTCRLALPYLQKLADAIGPERAQVICVSQDSGLATTVFKSQMRLSIQTLLDKDLSVSRAFDPVSVPGIFLIDSDGRVQAAYSSFSKIELRQLADDTFRLCSMEPVEVIPQHDGNPEAKSGCVSRHLVDHSLNDDEVGEDNSGLYSRQGRQASRMMVNEDPSDFCRDFDNLPVIPPTLARVSEMIAACGLPGDEIIAFVPPNYGAATVEKIAANAVMAGCRPEMMRVLLPLIRAACDEKFNLHGVQATTHFAAPLIIVNGPVREELGFASGSNVFSNVSKANSTLGRAFQLILTNIGGARPGQIDMSTLGNPGKFSYCIAENEEQNPWDPFHTEFGFASSQSAVTLFAAEPPRGVSEHYARDARELMRVISLTLATIWSPRLCGPMEAIVVLCPEHTKTIHQGGFTKGDVRDFLFENTCIPASLFEPEDTGEGTQMTGMYERLSLRGETHYRKFARPEQIRIIVAGGTAGKFSAVIGSWLTGERGSQLVSYPI